MIWGISEVNTRFKPTVFHRWKETIRMKASILLDFTATPAFVFHLSMAYIKERSTMQDITAFLDVFSNYNSL
jgi:hypothetical protein